ncbi:acetylcholine receptor subunit alpha-like [Amyelois transitella]|uniref:acetylcholine receptor subunit alpha-like n=1 Tax=Amyelois transitella TaxID=680683 RepID=UPI00298FA29E|nr:acetylcholine receptor subunit alpha-like [Amyelois transitella]
MDRVTRSAILWIFLFPFTSADIYREQILHQEAQLHKDLFTDYNSDYRPVKNHTQAVTVKVRFAVKYLSFDYLEETFTVHSWVAMNWIDEFLTWNPTDYGDIKEIQVESHEIWIPRMALFNSDATMYQSDQFFTTCSLGFVGNVTCVPHIAHSGICSTSLRRWPYDRQNCTLYFGSWMHKGEQVNYTFYPNLPVVLSDFQNGPAWRLLRVANERLPGKYACCPNETYPMLKYTFVLKREAAGPAAIVVVPSIVIVLLTLTSLLLGVKDNIRLLLLCFSLFGHFIFLTEIGYDIPKHGADTPIILLFVRDSMLLTLVGILVTLLLMTLTKREDPTPRWITYVAHLVRTGPGKYVVFTEFDPSDSLKTKLAEDEGNTSSETQRTTNDWVTFCNIINSVVFIISLLAYLILIVTYIPADN